MKVIGTAIACVLALMAACTQSDPDDAPEDLTWYGLARNTCGAADGPAISFSLDTVAYSGCGDEHEDESHIWYEGKLVDGLVPGQIIKNTLSFCPEIPCASDTVITLEILETNAADVHVGFQIESRANTVRKTLHSGKATLAKCRERPMCG